jgi:hypothetical protein
MADDILFHKYDLRKIIDNHRAELRRELDGMQDSRLLNTDLAELQTYAAEKYQLSFPVLGEPVVDEGRTKMQVGRYGGYPTAAGTKLKCPSPSSERTIPTGGSSYPF